jgi:hypothetical protein
VARILKWKEKLALGFVALFLWATRAWLPGARGATVPSQTLYSRLLTATSPKMAFGLELLSRKPYVRLVHASPVTVAMPLAAGAFVAMAGAGGAPAAASASHTCYSCVTGEAPCCSRDGSGTCCDAHCSQLHCYTLYCTGFESAGPCYTCGYGTCAGHCVDTAC